MSQEIILYLHEFTPKVQRNLMHQTIFVCQDPHPFHIKEPNCKKTMKMSAFCDIAPCNLVEVE
jgi:hypothetical protein